MNYYNEFDPQAAQWLRNLISAGHIAPGDVDERSIEDVTPNELRGYTQHHFFAGIGGWPLALDIAGWPRDRPVFTGSCPCQSFSVAGKCAGFADQRHLWPAWFHIIRELAPPVVFGEQVAAAIRHGWLDLVSADLEGAGYAIGSAVLGAHSVGAPHIRQRLYFVAESVSNRTWRDARSGDCSKGGGGGARELYGDGGESPIACSAVHVVAESNVNGSRQIRRNDGEVRDWRSNSASEEHHRARATTTAGHGRSTESASFWSGAEWIGCRDGKARPVEPKYVKMVDGISDRMVPERSNSGAPEEVNGQTKIAGPDQALRIVRQTDGEEDVPVGTGGQDGIFKAPFLRSGVHGEVDGGTDKGSRREGWPQAIEEGGDGFLRDMRKVWTASCSSQGREPDEQCPGEFDDFVRLLPSSRAFAELHGDRETSEALLALCKASGADRLLQHASYEVEEIWRSLGKEIQNRFWLEVRKGGFVKAYEAPLANGVSARVVRLRAYGNAIVPQTAAAFIGAYMDCERAALTELAA